MPGKSYRRWLKSLLMCSCDVFERWLPPLCVDPQTKSISSWLSDWSTDWVAVWLTDQLTERIKSLPDYLVDFGLESWRLGAKLSRWHMSRFHQRLRRRKRSVSHKNGIKRGWFFSAPNAAHTHIEPMAVNAGYFSTLSVRNKIGSLSSHCLCYLSS